MASIFWDSQGIIIVDYLEGCLINTGSAYYAEELRQEIVKKRGKLTEGVLFCKIIHQCIPRKLLWLL